LKLSTLLNIVADALVLAFVPSLFVILILIMFTCQSCATPFLLKAEYISHIRECTGNVMTFVYKEQVITVQKVGEAFPCYCSDIGCANGTKTYKNKITLRNHMTKVNSVWRGPRAVVSTQVSCSHTNSIHVC